MNKKSGYVEKHIYLHSNRVKDTSSKLTMYVGTSVGLVDGIAVGLDVDVTDGSSVGWSVGSDVGNSEGA